MKKRIANGERLERPELMEDIEDGDVWYREVMLECWKELPYNRPHISDLRQKLEKLCFHETVIKSDKNEKKEESRVANGYIQLNVNNELTPVIDNPVVNNPGYQVHTMSQSGTIILNSKPLAS